MPKEVIQECSYVQLTPNIKKLEKYCSSPKTKSLLATCEKNKLLEFGVCDKHHREWIEKKQFECLGIKYYTVELEEEIEPCQKAT